MLVRGLYCCDCIDLDSLIALGGYMAARKVAAHKADHKVKVADHKAEQPFVHTDCIDFLHSHYPGNNNHHWDHRQP